MTIKDLPDGKIGVVIAANDAWRGHCVYRAAGKLYFVGMLRDVELFTEAYNDILIRVIGDISVLAEIGD